MHRKGKHHRKGPKQPAGDGKPPVGHIHAGLELVLKSDTAGSLEAAKKAVAEAAGPTGEVRVIHAGVGEVSQSDLFLAETGSRLILGFNVGVAPGIAGLAAERGVEIRLYEIIYRLQEDIVALAAGLRADTSPGEQIIGQARVVALFKSSRKGIILGCEVESGRLATGDRFRIIGAMGPMYHGKIDSMQIDRRPVNAARPGQKTGLKIHDFKHVAIGDLVECYRPEAARSSRWSPRGGVSHHGVDTE